MPGMVNVSSSGDVSLSGFSGPDHIYLESSKEEATVFLEKIRRFTRVRSLQVHLRSSVHGASKLFEVRLSAMLPKGALHSSASSRDLYTALCRAYAEMAAQAEKLSGQKSGIHAKERGSLR